MWVQMRALEVFGVFMPVLFMIGVWKCHHHIWLYSRIILMYDMKLRGSRWWLKRCLGHSLPVLFMIRSWICHHLTWLCSRVIFICFCEFRNWKSEVHTDSLIWTEHRLFVWTFFLFQTWKKFRQIGQHPQSVDYFSESSEIQKFRQIGQPPILLDYFYESSETKVRVVE